LIYIVIKGVPIPKEFSADPNEIENAIKESLKEAQKLNIKGKKVTPFLLEKINKITKGNSLNSNIALIKNNAKTSALIANEYKKLELNEMVKCPPNGIKIESLDNKMPNKQNESNKVSLIGGINLDITFKLLDEKTLHLKGVTQPSFASNALGGVGN
jgi:hypothetical protein